MSTKRCLKCGTKEDLSKDHVVARFVLKTSLTRDQVEMFHRITAKKLNKQWLCRACNSDKGWDCVDYRGEETAEELQRILLEEFGVTIEVEVPDE